MKLLTDWGITNKWWQGLRGEYWVIAQGILLATFAFLPTVAKPSFIDFDVSIWQYLQWILTAILGSNAIFFLGRSLLDLGQNLTPLPHPRNDSQLVQTGIYKIVRHPLYSGVISLALAYASWQMSWVHLLGSIGLLLFFDAKARKEEAWLTAKFPEYASYCLTVKKLIPGIY
jgi:protein-S-isoprenylcysteine O-methyltransferase Ste14